MYKAIVFDFDGVITNGIPFHDKAYLKVFKKHGIKITTAQLHSKIGLTDREVISQILKEKSKKANINNFIKEYRIVLYELYKKKSTAPKQLIEFFDSCKRSNLKIAVASSTNSSILKMVLKKLDIDDYFDTMVGGEKIKKGKPNPEMIEKALKKLKIKPKCAIAIDDAKSGITAAKKIDMFTIAYLRYSKKQITEADINVSDFNEINLDKIIRGS